MNSSNSSRLDRLWQGHADRHDPGFAVIIAFDFYDGPERGLAVYPSGKGVRFWSLGDSRSRFFRAFELTSIVGEWWQQVRSLPEVSTSMPTSPTSRVRVPLASDALTVLENNVLDAVATGYSIGVGAPYLQWLLTRSVTVADLAALRQLGGSPEAFRSAHNLVRRQIGGLRNQ